MSYQKTIIEVTGCDPSDAPDIEDYMRYVVFINAPHCFESKAHFDAAAKKAHEDVLFMRSPEGVALFAELEKQYS